MKHMTMKKAVLACCLAAAVVAPACSKVDRPEGVVERWFIAINQGPIGEPQKFADLSLADKVIEDRHEADQLHIVEVGEGRVSGNRADVPYRIRRKSGPEALGTARLELGSKGWRIVALDPADEALRVPSQGGPRIGGASISLWLAAAGISLTLALMGVGVMSLVGKPSVASGSHEDPPQKD